MKPGKKIWLCISGLLLIALGVVCIVRPDITLLSAAWVIGLLTLFSGIFKMVFTFRTQSFLPNSASRVLIALLEIFFGCFFLFNLFTTAVSLPVLFAFFVIVEGVYAAIQSFDYKKLGFTYWWAILLLGIVGAVLGFLGLKNLNVTTEVLSTLIGLSIIVTGVAHIVAVIAVSRLEKEVETSVNDFKKAINNPKNNPEAQA